MSWVSNGRVAGKAVVTITQEIGWRRNYWITQQTYVPNYNAGPGQPLTTMQLGTLKFVIAIRDGTTVANSTSYLYDSFQVWSESTDYMRIDPGSDVNWIRGTQKTEFTLPNEMAEYIVYFYAAARLDTLMDTNAGCYFNVAMNIRVTDGITTRTRSPLTAGSIREYLEGCQEASFAVPFVQADGMKASVYPSVASCAVPGNIYPVVTVGSFSGNLPINCLNRSQPSLKCAGNYSSFTLDPGGRFAWYPPVPDQTLCSSALNKSACTAKINTDKIGCFWDPIGLKCEKHDEYAIQFTVKEDTGFLFSTYDVIFEVSKQCLASDTTCNHAPHFSPRYASVKTPNYNHEICGSPDGSNCPVLRGVEAQLTILAVDYDIQQTVTASHTLLPYQGFVFQGTSTQAADIYDQNILKATTPYQFKWIPAIDAIDVILCWQALDSLGKFSNGNYCMNLVVLDTDFIYVSGIIRDFSATHPDFNRPESVADNGKQWVMPYLSNGKPIQNPAVAVTTVSQFDQWFNTISGVNQQTVYSVQLIKTGSSDRYTYGNTNFLPIQGRLLGNDDTATGGGIASRSGINTFFTWEVHTYLIYNVSSNVPYNYSSSDDLWIFINGVLVPDWKLHGIHSAQTQTIDLRLLYDALGFDNSTLLYRVDMFYAMRSAARTQPVIKMELPKAVLCDALSSGVTQMNYSFSSTPPSYLTGTGIYTIGSSSQKAGGYSLLDQSQASSAVYTASSAKVPQRVKVLQGFQTTFSFRATRTVTQGFAFVMSPQNTVGLAGSQIGYGGLSGAIVVEFDMNIDSSDPNYHHVAVMAPQLNSSVGFVGKVYASHLYAMECSQYDPTNPQAGPFLNMSNGTSHAVRITYAPPQSTDASASKQGWLRVWIGQIVRPVVEVPIVATFLAGTLGDAAFVGFTSGSGTELASNILIENWQLTVVPPAPPATEITNWNPTAVAGQDVVVLIQARDSCGNAILVGADQDRYSAVFHVASSGRTVTNGIATEFTTNGDGTYNLRFSCKIVGDYQVAVLFDGEPIKSSPFPLTITPGPTSILTTNFVFATLDVIPHNAFSTETALYMIAVDPGSGNLVNRVQLKNSSSVLSWLNTWTGKIIAVSSIGSFNSTSPALVSKFSAMGCTNFSALVSQPQTSWVCIANTSGDASQLLMLKEATPELQVDFDTCSVIAQSNVLLSLGRLNVYRPGVFAASNTPNKVAVIARDQYGNVNTGSTDSFSLSFSPSLTGAVSSVLPAGATGYFVASFGTTVASFYTMNIALLGQGGGNILKIPSIVQVIAGVASPLTSTVSGLAFSNSQAGLVSTFSVQLIDAFGNQIREASNAVLNQLDVSFSQNGTKISTTKQWAVSGNEYLVSYTPIFVGPYSVDMVINGGNASCANGAVMLVIAGPLYAPRCTYSAISESTARVSTTPLTAVTAGTVASIWVQPRDQYGQARSNPGDIISFAIVGGVRDIVNGSYVGGGMFLFSFIPTVAPASLFISLQANGSGIGNPDLRNMSIPVNVGNPSSNSILPSKSQTVVAGAPFPVSVQCFDSENNTIPNCNASFFFSSLQTLSGIPSGSITSGAGSPSNTANLTILSNISGIYKADVRVDGINIVNSPLNVTVGPAITDNSRGGQSTPPSGNGAFGGVEFQNTSFLILCKDRFGNIQNHHNDNITFTVNGVDGGPVSALPDPPGGLWKASYQIPAVSVARNYNITYTINGNLTYVGTAVSIQNSGNCSTYWNNQMYIVKAGDPLTVGIPYRVSNTNLTNNSTMFTTDATINQTIFLVRVENASLIATTYQFTTTVDKSQTLPYVGTFTGLQFVGTYLLTAFANRVTPCTPTAQVKVIPGDVYPPATLIQGLASEVVAGQSSGFFIQLRDRFGQVISDQTNVLVVNFDNLGIAPVNVSTFAAPFNNITGMFYCNFTLNRTGGYSIRIDRTSPFNISGLGSPPTLSVNPGSPVAAMSRQTFPSPLIAGNPVTSVVTLSDAFGNKVTNLNTSRWTAGLKLNDNIPNPLTITPSASEGSFSLAYTPTIAGPTNITITLFDNKIAVGDIPPFTSVVINAGPIAVPPSVVVIGNSTVAGFPATIKLNARDANNNPIFGASLSALAVSNNNLKFPEVAEKSNGTYDITLHDTTVAGSYQWTLQVNAQVLNISIPNTTVIPGPVNWNQTKVPGLAGTLGVGIQVSSIVQLMDQYGNGVLNSSAADVALLMLQPASLCSFTSEGAAEVPVNVTQNFQNISITALPNGRLRVSYQPVTMGVYRLYLTYKGALNPCDDANIITVAPGQVYPPASDLQITNFTTAETTDVKQARIVLRDVYGNPIEDYNCKFLRNFSFGNHSYGNVQPNSTWLRPEFTATCTLEDRVLVYYITFNASVAGNWLSVITLRYSDSVTNAQMYDVIHAPAPLTVKPGKAFAFHSPTDANGTLKGVALTPRATIPGTFSLVALDAFGNQLQDTTTYTFEVVCTLYSQVNNVALYSMNISVSHGIALQNVSYFSTQDGLFVCEANLITLPSTFVVSGTFTLKVAPAVCPIFGCQNGNCVTDYSQCTDIAPACPASSPVRCWDKSCATNSSTCPCPSGQVRCAQGNCVTSISSCPPDEPCPSSAPYKCASGQCRGNITGCPSSVVCAPGFVICPDSVTCISELLPALTGCPPIPSCDASQFACTTGQCVLSKEDCPSFPTCPSGQVLCSDGSCRASYTVCPTVYPCPSDFPFRCFDGTCAVSSTLCPSAITCPWGMVQCPNGECYKDAASCPPQIQCPEGTILCSTGTCARNQYLCGTPPSCPASMPVMCPDRSCVTASADCAPPSHCSTGYNRCPDGSCTLLALTSCPSPTMCPFESPILCSNGQCANSTAECTPTIQCPVSTPLRCPDGACRVQLVDCATSVSCPAERPIKCTDGYCAADISLCTSPSSLECPAGMLRCFYGECVSYLSACPPHSTCSPDAMRCEDGTCRTNCSNVIIISQCPSPQIQCPQAGAGQSCATQVGDCPPSWICPLTAPIRCFDGSCRTTVTDCPATPTYDTIGNTIPCPDGTWSPDGVCGTPSTCPPNTFLCPNRQCVKVQSDCPLAPVCGATPATAGKPLLCGTVCVSDLTSNDCTSTAMRCKPDAPFLCLDGSCRAALSECVTVQRVDPSCPTGDRCRDGSCQINCPSYASMCLSQSISTPYVCPDGMCAKSAAQCNAPNGCPYSASLRCPNSGLCVTDRRNCTNIICPDGSWQVFGFCLSDSAKEDMVVTQCPWTKPKRCFDKTCVDDLARCTDNLWGSDSLLMAPPNQCPLSAQYRCPNGFCATASNMCPIPPSDFCANAPVGFKTACADGSCVSSSLLCPLIVPCTATQTRCPDGVCRDKSDMDLYGCPVMTGCPTAYPVRCDNGLCASSLDQCLDPTTMCPLSAPNRCPTGLCISDADFGSTDKNCAAQAQPGNGCESEAAPIKCWNGECVSSAADCMSRQLCPLSTPHRCPYSQKCVANTALECQNDTVVTPSTCPPPNAICRSCESDPGKCLTTLGCPMNQTVRCANGACAAFEATGYGPMSQRCPFSVVCDKNTFLCADGSCVYDLNACGPLASCPSGTSLCSDHTCRAVCKSRCPVSSPIACRDGTCTNKAQSCPGVVNMGSGGAVSTPNGPDVYTGVQSGCDSDAPIRCFDGTCRDTFISCLNYAEALNEAFGGTLLSCPAPFTVCADGSCVPDSVYSNPGSHCPIIPRCPSSSYRCGDGSCKQLCPPTNTTCKRGNLLCEDGMCRPFCLPYDGCPLSAPYHCPNRACAVSPEGCNHQVSTQGVDTSFYTDRRRLLSTTQQEPKPCNSNCNSQVKALPMTVSVDPSFTTRFDFALSAANIPIASLSIPSGALVSSTDEDPVIEIRPVADSVMKFAENAVHPSRQAEFGSHLPYSETLLSVAFECLVSPAMLYPFPLNLTFSATIDYTRQPLTQYDITKLPSGPDVCLAFLYRIPSLYYARWVCVDSSTTARQNNPPNTFPTSSTQKAAVKGPVPDCGENAKGQIYGFIHSPLPLANISTEEEQSWASRNKLAVVLIFLSVAVVLCTCLFFFYRMRRYVDKYRREVELVDEMEEEVREMEQYGGGAGTKDDEVLMVPNPLVVQTSDMWEHLAMSEEQKRQQQLAIREAEALKESRMKYKMDLAADRARLSEELTLLQERLKASQIEANRARTTVIDDDLPHFTIHPDPASGLSYSVVGTPERAEGPLLPPSSRRAPLRFAKPPRKKDLGF